MSELRFALRQLLKNPGFSTVAVVTLGICLGTNLTVFAVIDSVLIRPLPFRLPGRLVVMFNTYPKAGVERADSSLANYYERRGNLSTLSDIALSHGGAAIVGETGATVQEQVMRVSPEFFRVLGVKLALGRAFTEEEMTFQTDGVAILTDSYWRHQFNADPNVLGRQVRLPPTGKESRVHHSRPGYDDCLQSYKSQSQS
jgi:MacB-like periplasmic core domain